MDNRERFRMHKEAKNNLHKRSGQARASNRGSPSNMCGGGAGPVHEDIDDSDDHLPHRRVHRQPRAAVPEPDEKQDDKPYEPIRFVNDPEHDLSWDGQSLDLRGPSNLYAGSPVRGNSPYMDDPKGKYTGTLADYPFSPVVVPHYSYDLHKMPLMEFRVFRPAYSYLLKELPPSARGLTLAKKTGLAMLMKRFPDVEVKFPIFLSEALKAYVCYCTYKIRKFEYETTSVYTSDGCEMFNTRWDPINGDDPFVAENIGIIRVINSIECALPFNWAMRRDFRAVPSGDWFQDANGYWQLPNTPGKGHFRTVYFQVRGDRDFVVYDNSANNLCHGLKRLIGARPGETAYRYNSLRALRSIADVMATSPCTDWCGLRAMNDNIRRYTAALPDPIDLQPEQFGPHEGAMYDHLGLCMAEIVQHVSYPAIRHLVDKGLTGLRWGFLTFVDQLQSVMPTIDTRQANAERAHVKRQLRLQYVNGTLIHTQDDLMVRKQEVLLKTLENAKPGKPPRLVVSYGAGCMTANELPEMIKKCMARTSTYVVNGVTIYITVVGVPRTSVISDCFSSCIRSTGMHQTIAWCIFSDDQIVGGNVGGNSFLVNADISSNDTAQSAFTFGCYDAMASQLDPMTGGNMGAQCRLPLIVTDPTNTNNKLRIDVDGGLMGSGNGGTTGMNNTGSVGIAISATFLMAMESPTTEATVESCIRRGGLAVGHSLTTEWCGGLNDIRIEKCQFLKHSPCYTNDGEIVAVQNLGPMLRSFGQIDGIMTHQQLGVAASEFRGMTQPQRMEHYFSGVVSGYVHTPSHQIIDAMRHRFPPRGLTIANTSVVDRESISSELSEMAFCERYDAIPSEFRVLGAQIANLKCGDCIVSDLATRIFKIDYGL